jgi:hypothetical protein
MYMHIDGKGDAVKLAAAIHDALTLTKTPPTAPHRQPPEISFDTKQVDTILADPAGTIMACTNSQSRGPRKSWRAE